MSKGLVALKFIGIFLIVAVVLGGVIISLHYAGLFSIGQGFIVQSVSLTNLLKAGQPKSSAEFIISTVFNGGGQSLVGTIMPEDTERLLGGGYSTEYPVMITGTTASQSVSYRILNDNPQEVMKFEIVGVYKGKPKTFLGILTGIEEPTEKCPDIKDIEIPVYIKSTIPIIGFEAMGARICVGQKQVGSVADVETQSVDFTADISVTANRQTTKATISNEGGQNVVIFDNGLVTAKWAGNLVTGDVPPSGANYIATYKKDSSEWKSTYKSVYGNWVRKYGTKEEYLSHKVIEEWRASSPCNSLEKESDSWDDYLTKYTNCARGLVEAEIEVPNELANAIFDNYNRIGENQNFFKESGNVEKGKVYFNIPLDNKFIQNPNIIFTFRGDWVGVKIPQGKPNILSAVLKDSEFESGKPGRIIIKVKNDGDSGEAFSASLISCPGITQAYSSQNVWIEKGQTDELILDIVTAGQASELDKMCTVKVTAYNSGLTDTETVRIKMTKPYMCIKDKLYYYGGQQIYKCIDGEIQPFKLCPYGAVGDGEGGWKCGKNPSICVQAGKEPQPGEHCCDGLVYKDGICKKSSSPGPSGECAWLDLRTWDVCLRDLFRTGKTILWTIVVLVIVGLILWIVLKVKGIIK